MMQEEMSYYFTNPSPIMFAWFLLKVFDILPQLLEFYICKIRSFNFFMIDV